ncbi:MAG: FtsW/RodA/SpoVE family cell cycle protein [Puniceicoccales bacterium]|jgi:cell division protein FtsW|nr:FtsW/RodA/SpoVE family cell cycle protein [Puniceicoccales bacterium]
MSHDNRFARGTGGATGAEPDDAPFENATLGGHGAIGDDVDRRRYDDDEEDEEDAADDADTEDFFEEDAAGDAAGGGGALPAPPEFALSPEPAVPAAPPPLSPGAWFVALLILASVAGLTYIGLGTIASAGALRDISGGVEITGADGVAVVSPDAAQRLLEYVFRQTVWLGVAVCALVLAWVAPLDVSFRNTWLGRRRWLRWLVNLPVRGHKLANFSIARHAAPALYAAVCVGLVLVLVPGVGLWRYGARRWLGFGSFQWQVSDLAKLALVLLLARQLALWRRHLGKARYCFLRGAWKAFRQGLRMLRWFPQWVLGRPHPRGRPATLFRLDFLRGHLFPLALILVPCALIVAEPDLGTACLCALVGMTLLFAAGARAWYFLPTVCAGAAGVVATILLWPAKLDRVLIFLDPWATRDGSGQQLWQSMVAFALGGRDGVGPGNAAQQYFFLSESRTDFIFPVIGEEMGLFYTYAVVGLFLLFFLAVFATLWRLRHMFRFLVCLGAALFIVAQSLVNMGVVTALLPTKGMGLPFVSYGGTNLVIMYALTGLILNCVTNRREPDWLLDPPPPTAPAAAPAARRKGGRA